MIENADAVTLGTESYPVTKSKAKRLRQVVFDFDGESFIAIEQNPKTKSRWAKLARDGQKVMQFLQAHKYVAVIVAGKFIPYGKRTA